jgi:hypothetical protein
MYNKFYRIFLWICLISYSSHISCQTCDCTDSLELYLRTHGARPWICDMKTTTTTTSLYRELHLERDGRRYETPYGYITEKVPYTRTVDAGTRVDKETKCKKCDENWYDECCQPGWEKHYVPGFTVTRNGDHLHVHIENVHPTVFPCPAQSPHGAEDNFLSSELFCRVATGSYHRNSKPEIKKWSSLINFLWTTALWRDAMRTPHSNAPLRCDNLSHLERYWGHCSVTFNHEIKKREGCPCVVQ